MSYDRHRLRDQRHPATCTCVECVNKRRRKPRCRTPTSDGKRQEPSTSNGPVEPRGQVSPDAGPPPPTFTSPKPELPFEHRDGCLCAECREKRIEASTEKPLTFAATVPAAVSATASPKRVFTVPARPVKSGTNTNRSGPEGFFKFILPLLLIAAIFGCVWLWQGGTGNSSSAEDATQAAESGGNWFSLDCDSERQRRRGGWLRELIC